MGQVSWLPHLAAEVAQKLNSLGLFLFMDSLLRQCYKLLWSDLCRTCTGNFLICILILLVSHQSISTEEMGDQAHGAADGGGSKNVMSYPTGKHCPLQWIYDWKSLQFASESWLPHVEMVVRRSNVLSCTCTFLYFKTTGNDW